ncbi:MAG: phosphatidate cytidylyltransferase, partial [Acidimicrobiales bacterium]
PPTPPPALARPESAGRNLPQAAAVGAALFLTAVLAFRAGPAWSMVLVAVVLAVAAAEFFNSARRSGRRPATLLGIASAVALPLAVYWKGTGAYPVVLFLTVVVGLLWYVLGVEPAHNAVEGLGLTLLGVAYVGGLGSFAALILSSGHGGDVLLAAVIATVAYDIGGYVVGRNAGRSKLSDISPNKTVEGLFGGCILAVLTSVLVSGALLGLEPFDRLRDAALLGLVAAVAAPLGDLAESLLKRDFGVKDMGSVLPGHGGVLDRFDALLFVLPAVYYLGRVLSLLPA